MLGDANGYVAGAVGRLREVVTDDGSASYRRLVANEVVALQVALAEDRFFTPLADESVLRKKARRAGLVGYQEMLAVERIGRWPLAHCHRTASAAR